MIYNVSQKFVEDQISWGWPTSTLFLEYFAVYDVTGQRISTDVP